MGLFLENFLVVVAIVAGLAAFCLIPIILGRLAGALADKAGWNPLQALAATLLVVVLWACLVGATIATTQGKRLFQPEETADAQPGD